MDVQNDTSSSSVLISFQIDRHNFSYIHVRIGSSIHDYPDMSKKYWRLVRRNDAKDNDISLIPALVLSRKRPKSAAQEYLLRFHPYQSVYLSSAGQPQHQWACQWKNQYIARVRVVVPDSKFNDDDDDDTKWHVFADLTNRGFCVTSASKFGGDFLIYGDHPDMCHARAIVTIDNNGSRQPHEQQLMTLERLATMVKKKAVLVSIPKRDDGHNHGKRVLAYQTLEKSSSSRTILVHLGLVL